MRAVTEEDWVAAMVGAPEATKAALSSKRRGLVASPWLGPQECSYRRRPDGRDVVIVILGESAWFAWRDVAAERFEHERTGGIVAPDEYAECESYEAALAWCDSRLEAAGWILENG